MPKPRVGKLGALARRVPGRSLLRSLAFRTGLIKYYWRFRHLVDGSYTEAVPTPLPEVTDPHRVQLLDALERFTPMSLLEVGCADGINLVLAAERWPGIALSGVDVNPKSLAMAEQRLRAMGAERRTFAVSGAERLELPDHSIDVVVSDAVFMYLAPRAAERALAEMLRVARRGVAVHLFNDERQDARLEGGNWVHRFSSLLAAVAPERRAVITRSRLPHGQWEEFGALCVVELA